jgi:hypothetical protein
VGVARLRRQPDDGDVTSLGIERLAKLSTRGI